MDEFWSVAVPTWLTGVGTVGLAAFALLTMRADRRLQKTLRAEAARERARADEIERDAQHRAFLATDRDQAEKIVAYSDLVRSDAPGFSQDPGNYGFPATVVAALVMNDSALPVHSVNVAWCNPKGPAVLETRHIYVVAPRTQKAYARPSSLQSWGEDLPVEVDFADARGVHWKRDRNGHLTRLDPFTDD